MIISSYYWVGGNDADGVYRDASLIIIIISPIFLLCISNNECIIIYIDIVLL